MPRRMLALALAGYLLTTWAWALPAPLAPLLGDTLGLSPFQQALVVALPVIVGALSRVPAGALSDRLGARAVFLLIIAVTIVALCILATIGRRSVGALLAAAALLGVAGGTFAAAVPFVSGWFAGGRRGLAIGLLGLGLCGSAVGGFTAVRLASAYDMAVPFVTAALALTLLGLVVAVGMREPPRRAGPAISGGVGLRAALRLSVTRQAIIWYGVGFALFVTFSTVLPGYLADAYGVGPARGGDLMAVFVVVAVSMRPVGGWLADRFGSLRLLLVAYAALSVVLVVQAWTPPIEVFLALVLPVAAVCLGVSSTATLARISSATPPGMVGLVTGLVSAVSGTAGFLTPLLLALSFSWTGSYGPGFAVLAVLAAGAAWRAR